MTPWNPRRDRQGRFLPGNGGRPPAATNRAGRNVREALEQSLQAHLADTLERVRRLDPATYLRLLLRVIPPAREEIGDPADDRNEGVVPRGGIEPPTP